jgi:glycerophosphoryl diester phosphodiesterase
MFKLLEIIAHRGASYEEPENTLSAMKRAIDLKVDYIELDVHLSADGVPVVIHDPTFCRTTDGEKGKEVRKTSLHEIKSLDAGAWFKGSKTEEKIPTLEEVFNLPLGGIKLMIEIKEDFNQELSAAILELAKRYPHVETILGSFCPHTLGYIQKQNPASSLIGIAETHEEALALQTLELDHLALHYSLIMEGHQFSAQKIWAFTVDDHLIAQELVQKGVKGIITNNPKKIQNLL